MNLNFLPLLQTVVLMFHWSTTLCSNCLFLVYFSTEQKKHEINIKFRNASELALIIKKDKNNDFRERSRQLES